MLIQALSRQYNGRMLATIEDHQSLGSPPLKSSMAPARTTDFRWGGGGGDEPLPEEEYYVLRHTSKHFSCENKILKSRRLWVKEEPRRSETVSDKKYYYYGDPLLTGVNALDYHVAKNSPEISHTFRNISARTSYMYIYIFIYIFLRTSYMYIYKMRRDRKVYAKNPSYRAPLSTKNCYRRRSDWWSMTP